MLLGVLKIPVFVLRRINTMQLRTTSVIGGFLVVVVVLIMVIFHLNSELDRLDKSRLKIESAVAKIQLENLDTARRQTNDKSSSSSSSDDLVVIYNRVPKTASTSFVGVAYDLCSRNKFHVLHVNVSRNRYTLSLQDQLRFARNVTSWKEKKPAFYHGHLAFLNFDRLPGWRGGGGGEVDNPVYINVIRRPLDRLVSYYYFLRYGDDFRPYLKRKRMGDKATFDECVLKGGQDCAPENLWLQIPFFCGHVSACWQPGNAWALEQAKRNLVSKYLVVGVTEELESFVQLLEITLPRFFKGAAKLYASGKKSHLRKTANKKDPSPETVEQIQASDIWKMENEFYEFALDQFHFIRKKSLDIRKSDLVENGTQMFFYEKIRPKTK